MDCSINFIPKMNYKKLINGYKNVLESIYSQKNYYERVKTFLKEYHPHIKKSKIKISDIKALFKVSCKLGFLEKEKRYYWKLFFHSLTKHP